MKTLERITISDMCKDDLLLILEALEYTAENSGIEDYINLKKNIVEDLCSLTDLSEDEFIAYITNN